MVTDVAGFAAAVYHRGVRSCTSPPRCSAWSTPRSAARPASTCPRARTWSARSGSRRRCSATLDALATLPPREYRSGLRRDGQVPLPHRRRPAGAAARPSASPRCVAIKAAVVAGDEREDGDGAGRCSTTATPGPRPRDRRPTTTCATARRSPSAWSTPPSWRGCSAASTTTRVAEHHDVVGGLRPADRRCRRARPRRARRADGPRQEGASTA